MCISQESMEGFKNISANKNSIFTFGLFVVLVSEWVGRIECTPAAACARVQNSWRVRGAQSTHCASIFDSFHSISQKSTLTAGPLWDCFLSLNPELVNENLSYSHEAINMRNCVSFGQANIKFFKEFLIFIIRIFPALLTSITLQKELFPLFPVMNCDI